MIRDLVRIALLKTLWLLMLKRLHMADIDPEQRLDIAQLASSSTKGRRRKP